MTIGRISAVVIALGYVVATFVVEQALTSVVIMVGGILLVPLVLIWFPEMIGSATGYLGRHIDRECPPVAVWLVGWFLLVGLPIILYLIAHGQRGPR